jgi:hypothetical protein
MPVRRGARPGGRMRALFRGAAFLREVLEGGALAADVLARELLARRVLDRAVSPREVFDRLAFEREVLVREVFARDAAARFGAALRRARDDAVFFVFLAVFAFFVFFLGMPRRYISRSTNGPSGRKSSAARIAPGSEAFMILATSEVQA